LPAPCLRQPWSANSPSEERFNFATALSKPRIFDVQHTICNMHTLTQSTRTKPSTLPRTLTHHLLFSLLCRTYLLLWARIPRSSLALLFLPKPVQFVLLSVQGCQNTTRYRRFSGRRRMISRSLLISLFFCLFRRRLGACGACLVMMVVVVQVGGRRKVDRWY
jgi:hypothetical protein